MVAGARFELTTFGLWARRATRLLHPATSTSCCYPVAACTRLTSRRKIFNLSPRQSIPRYLVCLIILLSAEIKKSSLTLILLLHGKKFYYVFFCKYLSEYVLCEYPQYLIMLICTNFSQKFNKHSKGEISQCIDYLMKI